MRNVLFWGALPFIIPQALYVRRTAPRFARAAGPREGSVGKGTAFRLLGVGVNDITGLRTVAGWKQSLDGLLGQLHQHSPKAVVAVAGIPPLHGFPLLPQPMRALFGARARSFDAAAREVIHRHPFAVHLPLDVEPAPSMFSADGYHPSEASYQSFGRIAATRLAQAKPK